MTPTHVGITTLTSWTQIDESAHTNYLIHIVKERTRTPELGAGQAMQYTPLYIRVNRLLAEISQLGGKWPPTPSRCVLPAGILLLAGYFDLTVTRANLRFPT